MKHFNANTINVLTLLLTHLLTKKKPNEKLKYWMKLAVHQKAAEDPKKIRKRKTKQQKTTNFLCVPYFQQTIVYFHSSYVCFFTSSKTIARFLSTLLVVYIHINAHAHSNTNTNANTICNGVGTERCGQRRSYEYKHTFALILSKIHTRTHAQAKMNVRICTYYGKHSATPLYTFYLLIYSLNDIYVAFLRTCYEKWRNRLYVVLLWCVLLLLALYTHRAQTYKGCDWIELSLFVGSGGLSMKRLLPTYTQRHHTY